MFFVPKCFFSTCICFLLACFFFSFSPLLTELSANVIYMNVYDSGSTCVLFIYLFYFGTFSLVFCCLLFICYVLFQFVDFCFTLFYCNFQMSVCFLMRERKDVELDVRRGKEDLGGIVRGETRIRMHCIKKIYFI